MTFAHADTQARKTGRYSSSRMTRWGVAIVLVTVGFAVLHTRVEAQGPPPGVGQGVVLEGELDVIYEDSVRGGRLLHFLDSVPGRGRVPLRLEGALADLPSGSRVRVVGNLADGTVTATSVTVMAASSTRTLGEQSVLVILFNFSNSTSQPYTTTTVDDVNARVRDFYLENSYQQTAMTFTATGWHTISAMNTTCDYSTWATQADQAAVNAGFDVTAFARRVYAFPFTSACAWWGMGNVGGPRSWINGDYAMRVVAHEQGHNFGNRHSHAMRCDATGCVSVDYGDDRDVLGAGGVVGHLNAFQKERLGWLSYGSSPIVETVTTSGDYWISNYETAGTSNGLKVWNAATSTYYYVEVRQRVGFDAGVPPGVVLHTGSPSNADSSYQIDLAPTTTTWDSTLDVGQTFTDAGLGLNITTLSTTLDGALIRVTLDAAPCETAAPSVSLSPSAQSGPAGGTFQYTMTVRNNNSAGCAASQMSFSANVPSGWVSSFNPVSYSLSPGASVSTTLSLISPSSTSGSHGFNTSATDGTSGLSANASGSASILTNLNVTASAVVSSGKNRAATITVRVSNGSLLVAGATVTVRVTKPTGATSTLSATTGSTGVATVKYSIKPKDPLGIYSVSAVASASGTSGTATTSFTLP